MSTEGNCVSVGDAAHRTCSTPAAPTWGVHSWSLHLTKAFSLCKPQRESSGMENLTRPYLQESEPWLLSASKLPLSFQQTLSLPPQRTPCAWGSPAVCSLLPCGSLMAPGAPSSPSTV